MDPVIALHNTYNCLTREALTGNVKAQAKLRVFADARKRFSTESSSEYVQFVNDGLAALRIPGKHIRRAKAECRAAGYSEQVVHSIIASSKADIYISQIERK